MLVFGSSDTWGSRLPDPTQAWPQLVGRELGAAVGETVDVVNLPVVHVEPKAVPRVRIERTISMTASFRPLLESSCALASLTAA